MATRPVLPGSRLWVVGVAAAALFLAGLAAVLPPHPTAGAFAPPIVNIPKCYPRIVGSVIDCPPDLRNNGWGDAGATQVTGTASPGNTYDVKFSTRVPPCEASDQTGCYNYIRQYAPGTMYYLGYGASLSDQRLATRATKSLSSHEVALWSTGGICEAQWTPVYADGGDFAARAQVATDCEIGFDYKRSDGSQVPLDRLLGPTWILVWSSITVCDAATSSGCSKTHGESSSTLVRVDGDMWRSPVASCTTVSQAGPGGSDIEFDGKSSITTDLDSVQTWAFDPAGVTARSSAGYFRHTSTATVTGAPPGTLRATYLLQSWQGSSQATCTATVEPYVTTTPTPTPTPDPQTCAVAGKPSLKGTPQIGKTLRVVTRSWQVPGAKLSYHWKAGGSKVGRSKPKLKLTAAMRGKRVAVTVKVTAPSCKEQQAVLRSGKVRPGRR